MLRLRFLATAQIDASDHETAAKLAIGQAQSVIGVSYATGKNLFEPPDGAKRVLNIVLPEGQQQTVNLEEPPLPGSQDSDSPPTQPPLIHPRGRNIVGNVRNGNKIHNGDTLTEHTGFSNHRDKADAQARTPDVLKMSNKAGTLQQDCTICETSDLPGVETMGPLRTNL